MAIYRKDDTGKHWAVSRENGFLVLGDPRHGAKKHLVENAVKVRTEAEAVELLRKGFSIRVETATRPSLVRLNLFLDGQPLS